MTIQANGFFVFGCFIFLKGSEDLPCVLDVFSDLVFNGGVCEASIADPTSCKKVAVSFDRAFRECVVYTPPHREAICIEPYTCVPDAFRLERAGVSAGLRVLSPGESFQAHVDIRLLDG